MAIDKSLIGNFAIEAIDTLDDHFGGEKVTVDNVMLVVAFKLEDDDETEVVTFCNDSRRYIQRGLLNEALDVVGKKEMG